MADETSSTAALCSASTPNPDIEQSIRRFGRAIFAAIGEEQPSAFNRRALVGRLMEWCMNKPSLKLKMFQLVDVLPALSSSRAVANHLSEYLDELPAGELHQVLKLLIRAQRWANVLTAPLTAAAVRSAVGQMAGMFIAGADPRTALKRLKRLRGEGLAFTVDLLGEYSLSEREAEAYLTRYLEALDILGGAAWDVASRPASGHPLDAAPVHLSVKLSALYSQAYPLNFELGMTVLSARLTEIARAARAAGALLCVDAEDSAHNPIIYAAYQQVFGSREFKDFPYPGIVLQSYFKDAEERLEELLAFAEKRGAPIAVRLVKGAYWDFETVTAAQRGWPNPLFTEKQASDASFERLTRRLLENAAHCFPAFASHNIRYLSHACCLAQSMGLSPADFELQMLFGMAEPVARAFARQGFMVRLYVPIGEMLPGMGYLVRRLLENTSNESFLRRTFFDAGDPDRLLQAPASNGRGLDDREGDYV